MLEGVSFGPWVRSPCLSVRHRVGGGEPVVLRLGVGRWRSELHPRGCETRRAAERAVDRALTAQGADLSGRVVASETIQFRVTPQDYERFRAAAASVPPGGVGVSEWCRWVLRAAVGDAGAGTPAEVVE